MWARGWIGLSTFQTTRSLDRNTERKKREKKRRVPLIKVRVLPRPTKPKSKSQLLVPRIPLRPDRRLARKEGKPVALRRRAPALGRETPARSAGRRIKRCNAIWLPCAGGNWPRSARALFSRSAPGGNAARAEQRGIPGFDSHSRRFSPDAAGGCAGADSYRTFCTQRTLEPNWVV